MKLSVERFHTAGFFSALTTLSGVLLSPAVLNVVSPKTAAALTISGIALQAFTKPVTAGGTVLVPRVPDAPPDIDLPPPESHP